MQTAKSFCLEQSLCLRFILYTYYVQLKSLSSNSKIKIEIGANTGYVGINDGKIYYKSSKNAEAKYLGVSPVAMIAFAGNKVPNSCLLCDGGAAGKRSYPDLFGVIDTAYGEVFLILNFLTFAECFLRSVGS
ncbi:MAG: phage tail protein [Endomicrobium sp.]|nr:phage tail protein [Endomicrobium sp.]